METRGDNVIPARAIHPGEILSEELKERCIKQEQFAQKIGTKKAYISRIENGKSDIQLCTLFHIFEALGCKIKLAII